MGNYVPYWINNFVVFDKGWLSHMYLTVRCPGVIYNNSIHLTFYRFLFTPTFKNIIKIDNNCQSRHEHHSCYALKAAHIRSFSSRQVCALERAIEYDLRTKMPELRIMLFNVQFFLSGFKVFGPRWRTSWTLTW